MYATCKQIANKQGSNGPLDLYFLRYAEYQGAPDFDFNTFGSRYQGDWCDWLCDTEAAYQFGNYGAAGVTAASSPSASAAAGPTDPASPRFGSITIGPRATTTGVPATTSYSPWPTSTWAIWTCTAAGISRT